MERWKGGKYPAGSGDSPRGLPCYTHPSSPPSVPSLQLVIAHPRFIHLAPPSHTSLWGCDMLRMCMASTCASNRLTSGRSTPYGVCQGKSPLVCASQPLPVPSFAARPRPARKRQKSMHTALRNWIQVGLCMCTGPAEGWLPVTRWGRNAVLCSGTATH